MPQNTYVMVKEGNHVPWGNACAAVVMDTDDITETYWEAYFRCVLYVPADWTSNGNYTMHIKCPWGQKDWGWAIGDVVQGGYYEVATSPKMTLRPGDKATSWCEFNIDKSGPVGGDHSRADWTFEAKKWFYDSNDLKNYIYVNVTREEDQYGVDGGKINISPYNTIMAGKDRLDEIRPLYIEPTNGMTVQAYHSLPTLPECFSQKLGIFTMTDGRLDDMGVTVAMGYNQHIPVQYNFGSLSDIYKKAGGYQKYKQTAETYNLFVSQSNIRGGIFVFTISLEQNIYDIADNYVYGVINLFCGTIDTNGRVEVYSNSDKSIGQISAYDSAGKKRGVNVYGYPDGKIWYSV